MKFMTKISERKTVENIYEASPDRCRVTLYQETLSLTSKVSY